MRHIRTTLIVLLVAVVAAGSLPAAVAAQATPMPNLGNAPFTQLWARTDYPVLDGKIQRTFYFGPSLLLGGQEAYKEAPGGQRTVAYLDKARLELTDPASGTVTAGLLAKELISGKMQVGNAEFRGFEPAPIPVAGDPGATNVPTYASFLPVSSVEAGSNRSPVRTGQTVTEVLNANGSVGPDPTLARYAVTLTEYRDELGHNIPTVFTDFFKARGPIATITPEGVIYSEDLLIDWVQVMGLPLAEPYWAVVPVGGAQRWVLMQPFERRVVTYTPDNDPAYRVEMGNIGQHYKAWRHPDGTLAERPAPAPKAPTSPVPAPINKGIALEIIPQSGTANSEFMIIITGHQPGENLAWWFTDPNRSVWYPRDRQYPTPKDVDVLILSIIPARAFQRVEKGIWAVTFQGAKSGKSGVAYFEIK
jgi:hypothetical protein